MSKQPTLFGRVAKPDYRKSKNSVYPTPSNDYERFVENYFQRNRHAMKSKGCILKDAQQEWKTSYTKDLTSLSKYLAPWEVEQAFTLTVHEESHEGDEVLMDFGFYPSEESQYDVLNTAVESPIPSPEFESPLLSLDAAHVLSTAEGSMAYRAGHNIQLLRFFVKSCCPAKVNEILSEDVLNNDSFLSCELPVARSFFSLSEMRDPYERSIARNKLTQLRAKLTEIDKCKAEFASLLLKVATIKINPTLGTHYGSVTTGKGYSLNPCY